MNPSSIGGRIGFHYILYISIPSLLESLSESITYELEPFGIKVVILEPDIIKPNLWMELL
jgi:short-subunit dehydrogenase